MCTALKYLGPVSGMQAMIYGATFLNHSATLRRQVFVILRLEDVR